LVVAACERVVGILELVCGMVVEVVCWGIVEGMVVGCVLVGELVVGVLVVDD
jgi:hypothetical protein